MTDTTAKYTISFQGMPDREGQKRPWAVWTPNGTPLNCFASHSAARAGIAAHQQAVALAAAQAAPPITRAGLIGLAAFVIIAFTGPVMWLIASL